MQRITVVADPANANGSAFGGIRAGNAAFVGSSGVVGISAANVAVQDVVTIGDIYATDSASPSLAFGSNSQFGNVTVAGGDLLQGNSKTINNGGYKYDVVLAAGTTSGGDAIAASNTYSQLVFSQTPASVAAALAPQIVNQAFQLTANAETVQGGAGDDTIDGKVVDSWSVFDSIDGGAGNDSLTIVTSAYAAPNLVTVKNVETITINSTAATDANKSFTLDTSTYTGLTKLSVSALNEDLSLTVGSTTAVTASSPSVITLVGGASQTTSSVGAVTLSKAVGPIAATVTSQAAGAISVNGGTNVAITATGATTGTITVGNTAAASGAVQVNATVGGADVTTQGAIAITGGSTVSVTTSTSNAVNTTNTQANVTITGGATTTSATVTQRAPATAAANVVGVANGTVTINDVNRADATKAGVISTVSLANYGNSTIDSSALSSVSLSGKGGTLGIDRGQLTAVPTANTLTITTSALSGGAITDTEAAADDGFTTISLTNSGTTTIADLDAADLTTLNIAGAGSLTFTANTLGGAKTTSIVSTSEGSVKLTGTLNVATAYTGGIGVDTITIGATKAAIATGAGNDVITVSVTALGTGGSIDAGDGTDTLTMTAADAVTASATATFGAAITGFERLSLGNSTANQTVKLNNLDSLDYVAIAGVDNATTLTLSGAVSGTTLVANSGAAGIAAVSLATDGKSDVLNVSVSATQGKTVVGLTATGFETIAFATDDSATTPTGITHEITTLTDNDAATITVAGDAGLTLTTFSGTKLTTFDASLVTKGAVSYTTGALAGAAAITGGAGADTLNAASAVASVTITGNGGIDTLTGSLTKSSTIYGGDGNDVITGGQAADHIDGGDGADTFIATLFEAAGSGTTDGVIVNLSASTLTQAQVYTATGKYLTSAAPSVAANTATYLFNNESTTNDSIVDTLVSIEDVTGTTGTDYIVGSDGANSLSGGDGADTILGGAGGDAITGGAGIDTFVMSAASHSSVADGTATAIRAAGIDIVNVTAGDILDFGTDVTAVNGSGAATAVAVGAAGVATTGADLITAIAGAITEAAGTAFLIQVTDAGTGNTFSGTYLVVCTDGTFSANDYIVKVEGTNVSGNDTIAITGGNVAYTPVA